MNTNKNNTGFYPTHICNAFLCLLVFVITYQYVYIFSSGIPTQWFLSSSDYPSHLEWAKSLSFKSLDSFLISPWPLWHIFVNRIIRAGVHSLDASALVSACFAAVSYLITYALLSAQQQKTSNYLKPLLCAAAAFALMFVSPYYFSWIFTDRYLGQFSPNPFHNPPQMTAKPLGMLCYAFAVDLLNIHKNGHPVFFTKANQFFRMRQKSPLSRFQNRFIYTGFSLSLFFSILAKPSFAFVLLPSFVMIWIWDLISEFISQRRQTKHRLEKAYVLSVIKRYLLFAGKVFMAVIPLCLYIFFQFAQYVGAFMTDAAQSRSLGGGFAFSAPGAVWRLFSDNIFLSVCAAMAFALLMLILDFRFFLNSYSGRLGMLAYVTGVLEFLFLSETGVRFKDGNFAWSMMSGMTLLFFCAASRLIRRSLSPSDRKFPFVYNMLIYLLWFMLFAHMFSGFQLISPGAFLI